MGIPQTSACVVLIWSLFVPVTAGAGAPRTVDALAWMAGHWSGTNPNEVSEEIWLPPAAHGMVGMWRWAVDGKLRLYELLSLEEENGQVFMRLRHFRPNLHALEERDAPFVLTAVTAGEREVVFEGKGTEGVLRIGYRVPAPERLEAFVEKGGTRETFSYRRVQ